MSPVVETVKHYLIDNIDLSLPVQQLSLVVGVTTIVVYLLAGSEKTVAWVVALVGNAAWVAFAIIGETPLLLIMVFFMTGVYVRNLRRWVRRDRARAAADRQENAALGIFLAY